MADKPSESDVSEKLKEAKELEEQLATVRKLLNEHLRHEQKLCQQLQQTDPECRMTQIRRKCYLTGVHGRFCLTHVKKKTALLTEIFIIELRIKADEAEAERKKVDEELSGERSSLARIDEELQKGRRVLAEKEVELQNERKGRVEVEEALERERKGRIRAEEELQNERKFRVEIEERLRKSCADAEKELENERERRTVLEAELQSEQGDQIIVEAELQCERKNGMEVQEKFKTEQASRAHRVTAELRGKSRYEELERQLEDERTRRSELEEILRVESQRRVEAEELLKDVERECRSPFVVPALLEAFATISSVTSRALEVKP